MTMGNHVSVMFLILQHFRSRPLWCSATAIVGGRDKLCRDRVHTKLKIHVKKRNIKLQVQN